MGTGLFPEGKATGHEVPCRAEFKNKWSCTAIPPISPFHVARENIPFFLLKYATPVKTLVFKILCTALF